MDTDSLRRPRNLTWYIDSILNGYAQVFFSDNKVFAVILLLITFVDFYTGLFGFLAVLTATMMAHWVGFDKFKISQGYYGFNALLVGLGCGVFFQPGILLLFIVLIAAILTLFISVSFEGVIGKYALPYLSMPFVISLWVIMLASREFQALGLNERGIYVLNELYLLGGKNLVQVYEWWTNIPLPSTARTYFLSLSAIFFQLNILTGILVATGLLIYSRIAFTLSLLGFYTAYLFYQLIGASFSEISYSYIGFNYILSAIAVGGYFIIPNRSSYLWVMLLIPMVAVLTISLTNVLSVYQLPIYSLPFNLVVLLFLYVLKFRQHNRVKLNTLFVQQNSPEKNLYAFTSFMERFGKNSAIPIQLPFFGTWTVTQGHDGAHTHKSYWRHAWDFEIKDEDGKTFKGQGDFPSDYYCYDKAIVAPADGVVEAIVDGIADNVIGTKNIENNWGNTIIIKHADQLYSKLCHLKKGSLQVSEGDKVKRGEPLANCGNSGLSPFPHLHFQIQETPFIGSKTKDYPISNYMLASEGNTVLKTANNPQLGQAVGNIQINSALNNAFHFIPGEIIQLSIYNTSSHGGQIPIDDNDQYYRTNIPENIVWEVKRDAYLNTYIECEKSACRAWYKAEGSMFYFTHYEGNRNSILYYFYLGAYKVCLGHYKGLEISDTYPANMVFPASKLFFHDFLAPFVRYMKGYYQLTYTTLKETMAETKLLLQAQISIKSLHKRKRLAAIEFYIGRNGMQHFNIYSNNKMIHVKCVEKQVS